MQYLLSQEELDKLSGKTELKERLNRARIEMGKSVASLAQFQPTAQPGRVTDDTKLDVNMGQLRAMLDMFQDIAEGKESK